MMSTRSGRFAVRTFLGVLFAAQISFASAAPEDDFRAGYKAFHAGDIVHAMAILKKSADAGHAASQALLGDILDQAEFDEEAVGYYRKAALQGNAEGEFGLGKMYSTGEGVKRDNAEALKWITRSAERGHVLGTKVLAEAYIKGELGLDEGRRNGPDAVRWIRAAADLSHIPAIEFLARAYRTGALGLTADLRQADALDARARALRGIAENTRTGKKGRR
ncbi:MAG TPA: tetratricopeptide repeat protein [Burkholderiales bacterium]|nr:tetratricopeptide repeat protein [Burkholderiales bacterium]